MEGVLFREENMLFVTKVFFQFVFNVILVPKKNNTVTRFVCFWSAQAP